jgi:hypothetical protein
VLAACGTQGHRRMRLACGHHSPDAAHDDKLRPPMEEVKRIPGISGGAMVISLASSRDEPRATGHEPQATGGEPRATNSESRFPAVGRSNSARRTSPPAKWVTVASPEFRPPLGQVFGFLPFNPQSALRNPQCFWPFSARKSNCFVEQVSPGFGFFAPLLLIVYLSTASKVIHNGVCPCVHVTNHQIRVKIDQKGDVFRQKAIKNERKSSCPS